MGISVRHNADGSITVACGDESLTFSPDEDVSVGGPIPSPIPIIDLDDDPLPGWPSPRVQVRSLRASQFTDTPRFDVYVDAAGDLRWRGVDEQIMHARLAVLQDDTPVLLSVHAQPGQRIELGPVKGQLQDLSRRLGHRIVPVLMPDDDLLSR